MRRSLLIIGILTFTMTARSQVLLSLIFGDKLNSDKVEFGLEGGLNWSNIKNLDGAESLRGFNLGFYFNIKLRNPSWMISTGVIVKSSMGAKGLPVYDLDNEDLDSAFAGGNIKRKLNYFNVPVMIRYEFRNHFFVKSGIQLGLGYKAFDEFTNKVNEEEDLNYKLEIKDQFHPIDAGLAIGLGYHLMKGTGMHFGVQYYYGLLDITIDDSGPNQYNRVFYLTAGIPIGKHAKKNKSDKVE